MTETKTGQAKQTVSKSSAPRIRVGVTYYPEHWGKARLGIDIPLMREAGIQIVRMGEFAWSRLEPSEGRYDFSWLEEAVNAFGQAGISVVLGTPTAAPPAWFHQKYDVYPRDEWKRPLGFGTRLQRCLNHPVMRESSRRITEAMARHFGHNPFVEAWQTDNELTQNYCYCDYCAKAFREWLADKYGSLDNLNRAWGTVFWSQEYSDWEQIPLPWFAKCGMAHNPSLQLDYRRFQSDATVTFQQEQVNILRCLCPGQKITHNIMGLNDSMDYFALAADWDFAAWDNYPITPWGENGMRVPLGHDVTRGMKNRAFWIMEEQAGITGWEMMGPQTEPGQIRAWAWQAVSHGAETILFFRWRSCLYGTEQYWHGILNHDGVPRRHFQEVKQLAKEFGELSPFLSGAEVRSDVAIVHDADQHYGYHIQPQVRGMGLWDQILRFYTPLWRWGVNVDLVSPAADFSPYRLVILPGWYILSDEFADKVRQYVSRGGTVVMNPRTGVKNIDNVCVQIPLPGLLRDVAGITVAEYSPMAEKVGSVQFRDQNTASISVWADQLLLDTAEPFAWYRDSIYAGKPAVTCNDFGKGKAWYCGTFGDEGFYHIFLKQILNECGISSWDGLPKGTSVRTLYREGKRYTILVNLEGQEKQLSLPGDWKMLLGEQGLNTLTLKAYGIAVLESDRS
ncbi:MAG TPA: beta-galactosidase [Candidatus Hydrogenedentes bacterium]|nr:beta-galactosidase [Candidatus Hydrogenedentota bacterium]HOL77038.1 beta-galactosidase [Candidatus Hydrogenedentota bacterium]